MTVRVPATSANLGPGFDVMGLALSLYTEVGIMGVDPLLEGAREADDTHPAQVAFIRAGGTGRVWVRNSIPMGRGMGFSGAVRIGGAVAASVFGIDPRVTDLIARGGANLLSLKFSRDDETEADLVGLEIAARGGYRPEASVELWKKMLAANGNGGASWLSTHPSGTNRIHQLEANLPKVQQLYEQARRQG